MKKIKYISGRDNSAFFGDFAASSETLLAYCNDKKARKNNKRLFAALLASIEGLNEDIHNRRHVVALFLLFALAVSMTACSHNRRGDHRHGHKHHYSERF